MCIPLGTIANEIGNHCQIGSLDQFRAGINFFQSCACCFRGRHSLIIADVDYPSLFAPAVKATLIAAGFAGARFVNDSLRAWHSSIGLHGRAVKDVVVVARRWKIVLLDQMPELDNSGNPNIVRVNRITGNNSVGIVIGVNTHPNANLSEIGKAPCSAATLFGLRKGGKEQRCQDCDDGYYDEYFDQGEGPVVERSWGALFNHKFLTRTKSRG